MFFELREGADVMDAALVVERRHRFGPHDLAARGADLGIPNPPLCSFIETHCSAATRWLLQPQALQPDPAVGVRGEPR